MSDSHPGTRRRGRRPNRDRFRHGLVHAERGARAIGPRIADGGCRTGRSQGTIATRPVEDTIGRCSRRGWMGRRPGAGNLSNGERLEIRRRVAAGELVETVATATGRSPWTVSTAVSAAGGLPPRPDCRSPLRLSAVEREEISRGLRVGESYRAIAGRLGRAPSTISREVRANGGRHRYRAWRAELARDRRARRPRTAKLARDSRLRGSSSSSWPPDGRPSRSLGSCGTIIPTIRRCGCRTKRSISRCSSRAEVPCGPSSIAVCGPDVRSADPMVGSPGRPSSTTSS